MDSSYENEVRQKVLSGEGLPPKLEISLLQYLWRASPVSFSKKEENIHGFLSEVPLFSDFSDNQLRLFSKYLHRRNFHPKEKIFSQGESGYGFYFILSGSIDIVNEIETNEGTDYQQVINLKKFQYFGEMGLLEEYNTRNATAIAAENTVLLGIFKPDLKDLLVQHPVVGAKFLREISIILAARVSDLIREIMTLRKVNIVKNEKI